MPHVAIVAGERIESWHLSTDAWHTLKGSYRSSGLVMVCGQQGYPKTSHHGTQFFSHKANTNCPLHEGADESPEHLAAKAIVAVAARAAGWTATVEYPAPDRSWIADVLLEKEDRRVAVEIQWSLQNNSLFRYRQDRYAAAGLECVWFAGPKNSRNVDGVPFYSLHGDVDDLQLDVATRFAAGTDSLALYDATLALLDVHRFERVEAAATGLEIETALAKCWAPQCGKWLSYWFISHVDIETRCGQKAAIALYSDYVPWASKRVETVLQKTIRSAIAASDLPRPTEYANRFSKQAGTYYEAQVCPHCQVVQGDGFVGQDRKWTPYTIEFEGRFPFAERVLTSPHTCVDVGRGLCRQEPTRATAVFPSEEQAWSLDELSSDEDRQPHVAAPLPLKGSRPLKKRP